jgi:hypothetical protein
MARANIVPHMEGELGCGKVRLSVRASNNGDRSVYPRIFFGLNIPAPAIKIDACRHNRFSSKQSPEKALQLPLTH